MNSESLSEYMDESQYENSDIGIIYGKVGTTHFDCNVAQPVEKMDYVQMWHHKHGWVLGQIEKIERRSTLSIDKAYQITDGNDVDFEERISATVAVIGYRDDNNLLQAPRAPFKAGTKVYRAVDKLIMDVLGLKECKAGAYIGMLSGHDIKVYMDINELVQKHASILAKTGGGKSYMAGVMLEEIMKQKVTILILDPHGEYSSLKHSGKKGDPYFGVSPKSYASQIQEFATDTKINKGATPLKFTLANMSSRDLLELTNIKNVKTYVTPLRKALEALKSAKDNYTLTDIIRILEYDDDVSMGALINELEYLKEVNIFAAKGTKITDIVRKGMTSIINLKGTPPDVQALIVNRLSTALFELRKKGAIPPMMLVVEEAHNFCPQQGNVASSKIFNTVASEGRKFGLGLLIITQRAAKVDKNVLSQCNTQVILKVTNPNDLKAITSSVEGLTSSAAEEIQRIPIGTTILTAPNLSMPLLVRIRPRETKHGGASVQIVEE
jgi:DNA helicase HerA-like ATPase